MLIAILHTKNGKVKVVNKKVIREKTTFYNVVTNVHMNMFTNGILTSTRLNNIYPISNMRFVKGVKNTTEALYNVPDDMVAGLRLTEQREDVIEKVLRMRRHQL